MEVYSAAVRPMLLAVMINMYLSGLVGCQYVSYIKHKYNDKWFIKSMVIYLATIDTFVAVLTLYTMWMSCVPTYVGPTAFHNVVAWAFTIVPICTSLSGIIVHTFLIRKFEKLTNHKAWMVAPVMHMFSVLAFVLGMLTGIYGTARKVSLLEQLSNKPSPNMNDILSPYQNYVFIWMCLQVVTDAGISLILKFAFTSRILNGSDTPSQSRFNQITRCIIQTGFLSLLYSLAAVLVNMGAPRASKNVYVIVFLPLGRLYTSSVLSTLLARNVESATTTCDNIELTRDVWVVKDSDPESQTAPASTGPIAKGTEDLINSKPAPQDAVKIELPALYYSTF